MFQVGSPFQNANLENIFSANGNQEFVGVLLFSKFQIFTGIEKLLQIFQIKFHQKYV